MGAPMRRGDAPSGGGPAYTPRPRPKPGLRPGRVPLAGRPPRASGCQ